jgi:hypothetical protein
MFKINKKLESMDKLFKKCFNSNGLKLSDLNSSLRKEIIEKQIEKVTNIIYNYIFLDDQYRILVKYIKNNNIYLYNKLSLDIRSLRLQGRKITAFRL